MLDVVDRQALTCLGRARRAPRGTWLMSQGEAGDTVLVMLRGRVKISTLTLDGTDLVCAVHGPGSVIGHYEAIDCDGLGRTASVIAMEAVECRVLEGEQFRCFLRGHPEAAMAFLEKRRPIFHGR